MLYLIVFSDILRPWSVIGVIFGSYWVLVSGRQNGVEVTNEEPGAIHISIDTIQIHPKRSSCHNGVKTIDERNLKALGSGFTINSTMNQLGI